MFQNDECIKAVTSDAFTTPNQSVPERDLNGA
jgi:hypothetical protein